MAGALDLIQRCRISQFPHVSIAPSSLKVYSLLAIHLPQLKFIEIPAAQGETCSAWTVAFGVPLRLTSLPDPWL